eukprot:TRINITY_DN31405_c0_g1_i1.p1 TRINITY_DN31405_c0_g1~~TRINITY_DN31405_c0_g1_i1.p1  ORF type:complete len:161 (+),score=0.70 TRINITY_DN31405_c0_g1_i1:956-1438(+)
MHVSATQSKLVFALIVSAVGEPLGCCQCTSSSRFFIPGSEAYFRPPYFNISEATDINNFCRMLLGWNLHIRAVCSSMPFTRFRVCSHTAAHAEPVQIFIHYGTIVLQVYGCTVCFSACIDTDLCWYFCTLFARLPHAFCRVNSLQVRANEQASLVLQKYA